MSLHDIIKTVVSERGSESVLAKSFVGLLADYEAFQAFDDAVYKEILRAAVADGSVKNFCERGKWDATSKKIAKELAQRNSFDVDKTLYAFESIAYGLGWTKSAPLTAEQKKMKQESEIKAKAEAERKANEEAKRKVREEKKRKADEAERTLKADEMAPQKAEDEVKHKADAARREAEAKRNAKAAKKRNMLRIVAIIALCLVLALPVVAYCQWGFWPTLLGVVGILAICLDIKNTGYFFSLFIGMPCITICFFLIQSSCENGTTLSHINQEKSFLEEIPYRPYEGMDRSIEEVCKYMDLLDGWVRDKATEDRNENDIVYRKEDPQDVVLFYHYEGNYIKSCSFWYPKKYETNIIDAVTNEFGVTWDTDCDFSANHFHGMASGVYRDVNVNVGSSSLLISFEYKE